MSWVYPWASLALLLVACVPGPDLPGPSEGVTLYEHPNFGGDARTFGSSFSDLDFIDGPCGAGDFGGGDWENCASSVRVSPGWEATLYEHDDRRGDSLVVTSDIRDLDDISGCGGDWDNCASSIVVRPPR